MVTRLLIIGFSTILLSSCINKMLGEPYVKSIKSSQRDVEHWYQAKGLFNHFPSSISNKSVLNFRTLYPVNMIEFSYVSYTYLFLDMGEDSQGFYPDTFLYKTYYHDCNFVMDLSFQYYLHYDTLKVRNVAQSEAYPIPYFKNYDFGLGEERFEFLNEDNYKLVFDRHNVPERFRGFCFKGSEW